MTMIIDSNLCKQTLLHYGSECQSNKAVEEMAELAVELIHYKQNKSTLTSLISEIADVYIVLREQIIDLGITDESIQRQINYKQTRLRQLIENGEK